MLERGNPGRRRGLYPPGGNLTHALGQTSVSEVNDQTSSNPTVSRGSLAPPRHPRRGRGSGLVNVSMNNGILGLIRAHPCMGGGPRPSPAGRGSTDDGLQRLKLAHPYMGGGPRPSPAGRGSTDGGPQRLKLAHPYMGGGPRPSPAGRGSNWEVSGVWFRLVLPEHL